MLNRVNTVQIRDQLLGVLHPVFSTFSLAQNAHYISSAPAVREALLKRRAYPF